MKNPPVNIAKIAIGDGTVASGPVVELLPAVRQCNLKKKKNELTNCVVGYN